MSHTHEKSIAGQHVEQAPTTGSIHSGTDSGIVKDPSTTEILAAQDDAARWVNGTIEEKRLVRKLDWRILPCTWVLYLLGFLDRANIGNAKTGGLEEDFNLVFEVPANMILTRVRPSVFLPGLGLVWGTFAALMGATNNWQQLAAMRFLLGFAEAGFAPGCAFFLSSWYRKYELATRFALLYTSVPIAGAVSGLLAGLITGHMDGVSGLAGWRWLFILEGLASVVAAIAIFFLMPDYPSSKSRFLNEEESILACNRLSADGIGLTQGRGVEHIPHWVAFKMTVSDWRVWAQCFMFILVTGSQTMQYFIPTLVGSFGWTGVQGQYHTIPAYMAALVYVVGSCYLADRFKAKWQFVCGLSGLGCILFIAVTTVTNKTTQYVLTIFAFGTIYGCSPLVKTWVSDVIPRPAAKRAIAIALINSIGNASSIYATWLWPKTDAPRYIADFATTTSWLGILCVSAVVFAWLFKKYPIEKASHAEAIVTDLRGRSGEGENKA